MARMKKQADWVVVSHDPRSRTSAVRELVPVPERIGCTRCMIRRKTSTLFRYGVLHDDRSGAPIWDSFLFCSRECRDSYYNNRQ